MAQGNGRLIQLKLSPTDSTILKGIALLLLLFHHLFYIDNRMFDEVYLWGIPWVHTFAHACKVCVPLFVFLSGYGLMVSTMKSEKFDVRYFFVKRFTKLYVNYWLIWLLFVPIGVLCFGRTFDEVYQDNVSQNFVLDLFGVLNLTGKLGYNPTWWFYSCIIVLYMAFPAILFLCKKPYGIAAMLFSGIAIAFCTWTPIQPIRYYLLPFIVGVALANGVIINILPLPIVRFIQRVTDSKLYKYETMLLFIGLILTVYIRTIVPSPLLFDTIVAILIIIVYKNLKHSFMGSEMLEILGKHSFNIFLFHTFIYYYFFTELVYWNQNPIIIFLTLSCYTIIISILIEMLKHFIRFDKLLSNIENRLWATV